VRPVATDVGWSVGLLVTTVSCAKMAEPINMPFEVWTHRAKKLYIRWGPRSPQGRGSLGPFLAQYTRGISGMRLLFSNLFGRWQQPFVVCTARVCYDYMYKCMPTCLSDT